MDESETRQRLAEYRSILEGDIGYRRERDCLTNASVFCHRPNGDWLATDPDCPNHEVFIKEDGKCIPFFGALGKIVSGFGWLPAPQNMGTISLEIP
jgi:hypothetical protein